MRKQGIWVTRIIYLVLFLFVVSYMGYHVVSALTSSVGTVAAVLYTSETSVSVSGYYVRDEVLVPRPSGIFELEARSGQRLAKGDTLALTYEDLDTQRRSAEVKDLAARIEQLKAISRYAADITNVSQLDNDIYNSLVDVVALSNGGNLTGINTASMSFKSLLYKRAYTYEHGVDAGALIEDLTARMDSERALMGSALTRIGAEVSGTFSDTLDGYEEILSLETLDTMNGRAFMAMAQREPLKPSEAFIGKLATGFLWRYAAMLSEADAKYLDVGRSVDVRVDKSSGRALSLRVYRKDPAEDGRCFVVFESSQDMGYFSSLRHESIELVLETHSGVRIPRDAVRIDDKGRAGVYCLVTTQVKFKPVDILLERDNYYLVAYHPDNSSGVLPGDEVIVRAKDLFDGKVIQ